MNAYAINLREREDRWQTVCQQEKALGLEIIRVEAVNVSQLSELDRHFVAPGVAATWRSHQKAMSKFLETTDEYCLILEDDFLLTPEWNHLQIVRILSYKPDFFQAGYLVTSPIDQIELTIANVFDSCLKVITKMCGKLEILNKRIGQRLLIREQRNLEYGVIPTDIRAGGQAYVVSRKFAEASKHMNNPPFTSADGVFMSLGDVRTFRMFRFRRSLINQTDSATSVENRYL